MRAGRFRHRLVLQSKRTDTSSPQATRTATGGVVGDWITEATVWGGIEPLSGKELFSQQQIQSEASVRIVMRRYTGMDTTWRVVNDAEAYAITEVSDDDEITHLTTLHCLAGVKDTGDLPAE